MGLVEKIFGVGDIIIQKEDSLTYVVHYRLFWMRKNRRFSDLEDVNKYLSQVRYDRIFAPDSEVNSIERYMLRNRIGDPRRVQTLSPRS